MARREVAHAAIFHLHVCDCAVDVVLDFAVHSRNGPFPLDELAGHGGDSSAVDTFRHGLKR